MTEKLLHVRVAEALGWTECEPGVTTLPGNYVGWPPGPRGIRWYRISVPRYDMDWEATGPLIERLQITLYFDSNLWHAAERGWPRNGFSCHGSYPLEAVCHLILALFSIE